MKNKEIQINEVILPSCKSTENGRNPEKGKSSSRIKKGSGQE